MQITLTLNQFLHISKFFNFFYDDCYKVVVALYLIIRKSIKEFCHVVNLLFVLNISYQKIPFNKLFSEQSLLCFLVDFELNSLFPRLKDLTDTLLIKEFFVREFCLRGFTISSCFVSYILVGGAPQEFGGMQKIFLRRNAEKLKIKKIYIKIIVSEVTKVDKSLRLMFIISSEHSTLCCFDKQNFTPSRIESQRKNN